MMEKMATHNNKPIIGVAEVRGKLVMTSMTINCAKRRNKIDDNGGGDEQMIRVMVW
jgi:hypothetical protein